MQSTTDILKNVFVPTFNQAIVSILMAVAIQVVAHYKLILALIAHSAYVQTDDVGQVVASNLVQLSQVPNAEKVSVGVFWAVVASIVYVAAVMVNNMLISTRNEVVIDTQFANNQPNHAGLIKHFALRVAWGVVMFAVLALSFTRMLPIWLQWFGAPFYGPFGTTAWLAVGGLAGLAINIYALWILLLSIRAVDAV